MKYFRSIVQMLCAATIVSTLVGCARFPSTPATTGRQLVLTIKVRGRISPTDTEDPNIHRYYFIAFDNDNNQYTGPWAVVYPPFGGNGWVTSKDAAHSIGMTSFIAYDVANPDGYIYGVQPGSYFLNTTSPQVPIDVRLLDGGATLRFTIDLSQIATTLIPADQIRQLDINFITADQLAVDANSLYTGRQWDALGPSGQNYVTIDTTSDRIYWGGEEDTHTTVDPDLDIIYWSAQVQTVASR